MPCAKGVGGQTEQRDKEEDWDEWLWVEAMEPARCRQHRESWRPQEESQGDTHGFWGVLETTGRESGLHMASGESWRLQEENQGFTWLLA